jgi:hypothetical protein
VHQGEGALLIRGDVEAIKAKEMEARQHTSLGGLAAETEPELDQFMEAYHEVLVKLWEKLTRPLKEAMKFMRKMEPQLSPLSISGRSLDEDITSIHIMNGLEKGLGVEEEQQGRHNRKEIKSNSAANSISGSRTSLH